MEGIQWVGNGNHQRYERNLLMVMTMIMVVSILTGRRINFSTTRFTMIAAAGLAEYHSPPQISG